MVTDDSADPRDDLGAGRLMPRLCDYLKVPGVDLSDLATSDTCQWIVLRRASQDRLRIDADGNCFDQGRWLGSHLRPTVALLISEESVDVVTRTYDDGITSERVGLTEAGRRRFAELAEHRDCAASRARLVQRARSEHERPPLTGEPDVAPMACPHCGGDLVSVPAGGQPAQPPEPERHGR